MMPVIDTGITGIMEFEFFKTNHLWQDMRFRNFTDKSPGGQTGSQICHGYKAGEQSLLLRCDQRI